MDERLDVVDQRRPAEVALLRREGRPQPRHPAAALHRLEHRRLLAADVRAGADDDVHVQPALGDRLVQAGARGRVLLAEVDVCLVDLAEAHRRDQALEQEVRPQLHHVAVLDRPGLALVRVDDHDARGRARGGPRPTCGAVGKPAPPMPVEARCLEAGEHLARASSSGGSRGSSGSSRKPFVRCGDAAADVVAVHDHRGEVAVAEAGHGELPGCRRSRADAVADRPGADADHVHRHAAGTSRTRRPRAPRLGGCSCGRRARPTARA